MLFCFVLLLFASFFTVFVTFTDSDYGLRPSGAFVTKCYITPTNGALLCKIFRAISSPLWADAASTWAA